MDRLQRRLNTGACEPFLREIRFPNLKNLEPGLRIKFEHPITALVGPNGTNKTTILRALQGCPRDYDLGNHWFGTGLDRVEQEPARYIHAYELPSGATAEVIKTRVSRAGRGADYFETRAPRISDGMARMPQKEPDVDADFRSTTRWKPIDKSVVYLDFRHTIPAFDIHFLFDHYKRPRDAQSKKDLVRRRSGHLAKAIASSSARYEYYGRNRLLDPPSKLSQEEVDQISRILGRNYEAVRIVRHDFFDVIGQTALIRTPGLAYSEAFAGSGEYAVITLVHALAAAENYSLVLLDEPETSLHPTAQRALVDHIARVALQKGLQVVFSTHSPTMIETLPPESIRVLDVGEDKHVHLLSSRATAREAFNRIGVSSARTPVVVEDELTRALLQRAARTKGLDALNSMDIQVLPGGASSILNSVVPALSISVPSALVVLDGDQRSDLSADSLDLGDEGVSGALESMGITKQPQDGGDGDPDERRRSRNRALYEWCRAGVVYLPGADPESLLLELIGEAAPGTSKQAKAVWELRSRKALGKLPGESVISTEILETQRRALTDVSDDSPLMQELVRIVEKILAR